MRRAAVRPRHHGDRRHPGRRRHRILTDQAGNEVLISNGGDVAIDYLDAGRNNGRVQVITPGNVVEVAHPPRLDITYANGETPDDGVDVVAQRFRAAFANETTALPARSTSASSTAWNWTITATSI